MQLFSFFAVYFVVWWMTLFAVLPFGVQPAEEGDLGRAVGAPARPRIALKALVTTGIATVIWLFVYWAVSVGLVNFRGP